PPKMLSCGALSPGGALGGAAGGAVGACQRLDGLRGGDGGVVPRRTPTSEGRRAVASPPTITAGRATTTPSAVGLLPPYGAAGAPASTWIGSELPRSVGGPSNGSVGPSSGRAVERSIGVGVASSRPRTTGSPRNFEILSSNAPAFSSRSIALCCPCISFCTT